MKLTWPYNATPLRSWLHTQPVNHGTHQDIELIGCGTASGTRGPQLRVGCSQLVKGGCAGLQRRIKVGVR